MWQDDETVMISAVEHYSYCARQCALIHIEQVFEENVFTLRGTRAHERVDTPTWEMTAAGRVERALPIWSDQYGLTGRADVVEFHQDGAVYPVETKHGPRREQRHDDLQLCAQAVCLEEMFGLRVREGAVYYHSTRRRREVIFTDALRADMAAIVMDIRRMRRTGTMPPPLNDARCRNCSLVDVCVPEALSAGRQAYHQRQLYRSEIPVSAKTNEE